MQLVTLCCGAAGSIWLSCTPHTFRRKRARVRLSLSLSLSLEGHFCASPPGSCHLEPSRLTCLVGQSTAGPPGSSHGLGPADLSGDYFPGGGGGIAPRQRCSPGGGAGAVPGARGLQGLEAQRDKLLREIQRLEQEDRLLEAKIAKVSVLHKQVCGGVVFDSVWQPRISMMASHV